MKLYYSPGACSLSPHIVAREAGIPVELVKVDLKAKKLSDGAPYGDVNGKGYVPAIRLDDGQMLTKARRSCSTSPTRSRTRSSRPRPARWSATACRSG